MFIEITRRFIAEVGYGGSVVDILKSATPLKRRGF